MLDSSAFLIESILEHIDVCDQRMMEIKKSEDFINTQHGKLLLDAIAIRLQAIGECIKKLLMASPEIEDTFPSIQWKNIIRFRDFISHHYDSLDYEIVFNICKEQLPELKKVLSQF